MSKIQDHSDRERPVGSDALTSKERAVLTLTDAGLSLAEIADRTDLAPHRVASIQKLYADNGFDHWKAKAEHGSFLLSRAIGQMQARRRGSMGAPA